MSMSVFQLFIDGLPLAVSVCCFPCPHFDWFNVCLSWFKGGLLRALYERELEKRGMPVPAPAAAGAAAADKAGAAAADAEAAEMVAAGEAEGPSEASLADPENEGEEEDEPWADDVEVVPEDEIPEESFNVD